MQPTDLKEFRELLMGVCSLLTRGTYQPDPASTALFFNALRKHSMGTVRAAFQAHIDDPKAGKFSPMPSDILGQIERSAADDGRPNDGEAWATALRAADESATVVWTAETAEAWGICRPVLDVGDEVGARMAFKSAYNRLVAASRDRREPVRWSASEGHDQVQRDDVLRIGVESGLLPAAYLPAPRGPVAGLLELSQQRGCPPSVRERLMRIREQVLASNGADAPGQDHADKLHTADLKAAAAAAVERAMRGKQ